MKVEVSKTYTLILSEGEAKWLAHAMEMHYRRTEAWQPGCTPFDVYEALQ